MSSSRETKLGTSAEVFAVFADIARRRGFAEVFAYISHCGITDEDMDRCGGVRAAILDHYRAPGTSADAAKAYDIERVAQDLLRWPPVVERLRELQLSANSSTPTIH
jgi:hypothetical protein